ncbi:MAG: hypothetical protein KBF17_03745 [Candidatus Promineofilum sp.]|nr:hypothetical protein [Promineifilum sp.]MBP9657280.1 hypothetical protein [Promineifilum sp.]
MRLDKLTEKSREALLEAQHLAEEYNYPAVEPEHLLAALLQQENGVVPSVISKIGGDPQMLLQSVEAALSDAVYQTDIEDMRLFPPGVVIRPYGTLVVTISAAAFHAEFGASPDLEIVISDPAVPDMIDDPAWGDPEALFRLANSGDEVLLWRIGLLDVVTYGDGYHSAVVGCPLLAPPARSLQRDPYWDDTDNCPRDFRGWPFPSPGRVP